MTDEQLIISARAGDKNAQSEILKKYSPLAKSVAAGFFISGGTDEDLFQEGMVGLYSAIGGYDTKSGITFSTYAYKCVRNAVIDAVKKSLGAKYSALNNFVPIVEIDSMRDFSDPEDELIRREQRGEFLQRISALLSAFEFKVTVMYLDGLTNSEIASSMGKSAKSVGNALARAKNKLQKSYYKQNKSS